jgi:acyl-coenzyme A synthetase/AMP-(fatty) acid ligase
MAGYWGRPDLDDTVFATDATEGGLVRRWYRSGDVVERTEGGLMTFVGRVDRQVKVRGTRVELEAVEAALDAVDGVTASAAVCVDDPMAPLVGIVQTSTITDERVVQRAIRATLPPGAIPDRIVLVASLPITASGKVDTVKAAELLETGVST